MPPSCRSVYAMKSDSDGIPPLAVQGQVLWSSTDPVQVGDSLQGSHSHGKICGHGTVMESKKTLKSHGKLRILP